MTEAVAAGGDHDRAEALAHAITDPYQQAQALTAAANVVGPARARRLLGQAFAVGRWWLPMPVVARVDPQAALRFVTWWRPEGKP